MFYKRAAVSFCATLALALLTTLRVPSNAAIQTPSHGQLQDRNATDQVAILIDTNPDQKNVMGLELSLAERVVRGLSRQGNRFSVISFGSEPPISLVDSAAPEDALTAIRNVKVDPPAHEYFSVHLYDALDLAVRNLAGNGTPRSVIVISEGDDLARGATFRSTLSLLQKQQVRCFVVLAADHSLYGSKGIQRYGFSLRKLARRTHGVYIEVGNNQNKLPLVVKRLSDRVGN